MDGNTFTKLDKGILASSTDQLNAFSAKNCHFEQCAYGIKAKNVHLTEIEKNTFNVNPDFLIEPEVPAYGVHLLACSRYTVENNEFYGEQNSDLENVGIVISKSNPELDVEATQADYNRIYRNKFHDLYAGSIAQGSNSSGTGIDDIGLEILCGEYENNQFHVAVTNEGTIEVQQGSTADGADYAARNFFYTQDVEEGTLKVNEDSEGFVYLYYDSQYQEPNSNSISNEVFPSVLFFDEDDEIYENFCPIHTIYNPGDNIYTVKSRYIEAQEEELEKKQEVEELEDGGNSTYVGSVINDLTRTSLEVRNTLYPMSPYLSDRALKGIIERQIPLSNWHVTELLIANSPLSLDVLNTYYENGRMEDFFHYLILLYQTGESSLSSLKATQKEVTTDKQLAKSKYLKLILFELEEAALEAHQLEEVLEAERVSTDYRFKFDRVLQSENYFIAQQLIDTYPNSSEKDAFGEIAQIRLDRKMSGDDCCQLSVNHVNILQNIADSEKEGKFLAQALLENENEIESEEIIILPEAGTRKSLNNQEADKAQWLELFEIYPNPTSDFAYFTFMLPEEISKSYISIYDTNGKQVEQIDLSGIRNVLRLDVSNYDSGVYTTLFTVDGHMISKKSIVVVK